MPLPYAFTVIARRARRAVAIQASRTARAGLPRQASRLPRHDGKSYDPLIVS